MPRKWTFSEVGASKDLIFTKYDMMQELIYQKDIRSQINITLMKTAY